MTRLRKVEAELQRVMAELVSREVKDPRVGNVTITAVSVSPDMKLARIFYVPVRLRRKHQRKQVQEGLISRRWISCVGRFSSAGWGCGIRPRCSQFVFDESIDRAATGLCDLDSKEGLFNR